MCLIVNTSLITFALEKDSVKNHEAFASRLLLTISLFDSFFKTSTHALKSSYRSVNGKVNTAKKAAKRLIFCFVSSTGFSSFFADSGTAPGAETFWGGVVL